MTKALSPIHVKHIDEKYMMKLMRIDYSWLILPDSWYLITACLMTMVPYALYIPFANLQYHHK